MHGQTRYSFFALIVLLALLTSLALPITVFADEQPTPAPAGDVVATDPPPAAVDTPVPAQPTQDVDMPVMTDTPAPTDTDVAPTDSPTQVPTDTPVVVVNDAGTVEPLATQAAADIVADNDPMWCPSGQTPGGAGCTSSYSDVTSLITALGTHSGAGTVYFTPIYSTNDATFSHSNLNLANLTDLTIQGGWNGLTGGAYGLSGVSVFSVPLTVVFWNGDVTINDITISAGSFAGDGLYVQTAGNINVDHVNSSNNKKGNGAYLDSRDGDGNINVTSSTFNQNNNNGLEALSAGSITLANVTAGDGNGNDGAYLDNSYGTGSINVSSSTFTGNGTCGSDCEANLNGLEAYSTGDITLTNVTANSNYGDGAYLDNTSSGVNLSEAFVFCSECSAPSGNIIINGSSNTFNGNLNNGLDVISSGSITLNNVTADSNSYIGAFLGPRCLGECYIPSGDITVSNSEFNDNTSTGYDFGLFIDTYGDVTLSNVTASNNRAGDGADIYDFASLTVQNSTFNNNYSTISDYGDGLYAVSDGLSTALNTLTGPGLEAPAGFITITCSDFSNNSDYGLYVGSSEGSPYSLTLNSDTFSGNHDGDYYYSGTATLTSVNCGSKSGHSHPAGIILPLHTVNITGGENTGLDCTQYSGTELILPNQDSAIFPCPLSDSASLASFTADKLPGTLPDGNTFVSAFATGVLNNGSSQSPVNGLITVSFTIPDNMKDANLAILYWDGSQWVEVPGGHVTADGHFEALTNLTGTFVLVSK